MQKSGFGSRNLFDFYLENQLTENLLITRIFEINGIIIDNNFN